VGIKKITGVALGVAAAWAVAAPCSFAGVGSVISSFYMSGGSGPQAVAVYRDADFVYGVLQSGPSGEHEYELSTYTPTGSLLRSIPLSCSPEWAIYRINWLEDADHSVRGKGYFGIIGVGIYFPPFGLEFNIKNGSIVGSFPTSSLVTAYAHIPGGQYIYVGQTYPSAIFRFTTSGSLVSSFNPRDVCDHLAATDYYEGLKGAYLISYGGGSGLYHHIYTDEGSLVGSFWLGPFAMTFAGVCGPGYPSFYGTTYWCIGWGSGGLWCYQIDLANRVNVAPASVGRIKTLYR
jgi:hypothetical protein